MAKFITEDDIEQEILKKLKNKEFNYDIIICDADPNKKEDLNDGTEEKKQEGMYSSQYIERVINENKSKYYGTINR